MLKKILLNANYDHPLNQGGVSTFNRNIMKMFQNENKFEIKVLCYHSLKEKIHQKNLKNIIEIYKFPSFFKRIDRKILKYKIQTMLVKKKILEINPDIFIMNEPKDLEKIKDKKIKKILVQHMDYKTYINFYFNGKEDKLIDKTRKELDYFVCLSEYDKQKFSKELKIAEDKIVVIRHTSEIEKLEIYKKKNKVLIMVARLYNDQKRFDLAIKAMKKLPDFTLKIYGAGDKNFFNEIIKNNKLKNVEMCGPTSNVQEKLDESGILIMTSDFEGYPMVAIEAMRRGLPIVLRNTFDSARDIIPNNENGILLDKEWDEDKFVEAVRKIYENYEYYSENSKKLGERYSFENIQKKWLDLVEELNK